MEDNNQTQLSGKTKINPFAKAGIISFCISVGITVLSLFLILVSSNEGEFFSTKMAVIFAFLWFIVPTVGVLGLIGSIFSVIAGVRTKSAIILLLNLAVFIISSLATIKIHQDQINWFLSNDRKLEKAIVRGDVEAVKIYLSKGAHVDFSNRHGATALQIAVRHRKMAILRILLDKGAAVDKVGWPEFTPLVYLLTSANTPPVGNKDWNDFEAAKLLLERGANPNAATNWEQKTCLLMAAQRGDVEMFDLLLAYGADINWKNVWTPGRTGNTALHYAVWIGDTKLASFLLDKGADINVRGVHNATPLHYATEAHQEEMAKLLLYRGADPNARDDSGRLAISKYP